MNNKRRVFVEEYFKCWNASEAARRADYKHPHSQGPRLLENVEVQQEIQRRIAEKCMDADEVLVRLAEHARGVPSDYIDDFGFVSFKKLKEAGLVHLIKKVKRNQQGIEIEFYDQQRAMELIGKHLKMWTEKHEVTGKDGKDIKVIVEYVNSPITTSGASSGTGED